MLYVASSWRNPFYTDFIERLKQSQIPHYDFRHDGAAFDWADVDSTWKSQASKRNTYTMTELETKLLAHPAAQRGFAADAAALYDSDFLLLILPCGRSAHLELGIAIGSGKPCAILSVIPQEPELMYMFCDGLFDTFHDALDWCERTHADTRTT